VQKKITIYQKNGYEEHQIGLGQKIIQFVKSVAPIIYPRCKAIQPSWINMICPLMP
jgi:hypothetical protein